MLYTIFSALLALSLVKAAPQSLPTLPPPTANPTLNPPAPTAAPSNPFVSTGAQHVIEKGGAPKEEVPPQIYNYGSQATFEPQTPNDNVAGGEVVPDLINAPDANPTDQQDGKEDLETANTFFGIGYYRPYYGGWGGYGGGWRRGWGGGYGGYGGWGGGYGGWGGGYGGWGGHHHHHGYWG